MALRIKMKHVKLIPMEWAVLVYTLFTTLLIGLLYTRLNTPADMLAARAGIVAGTALFIGLHSLCPCRLTLFLRVAFQLGLLAYWYPDTYEFNRLFPNLDHLFATLEQQIFGCQPAVEFSRLLSGTFWSEAFNLGYWAYYPMIGAVVLYNFLCKPARFNQTAFILIASFFLYYTIYIFLPVAGPQYYYPAIGYPQTDMNEIIHQGFPAIGDYFNHHAELLPSPGDSDGFFFRRVAEAQAAGERPTAAFPSSHVGISTILLFLSWRSSRRLFAVLSVFYLLLCCATVYIQAHYLIDAFAGMLSGVVLFLFTRRLSEVLWDKEPGACK